MDSASYTLKISSASEEDISTHNVGCDERRLRARDNETYDIISNVTDSEVERIGDVISRLTPPDSGVGVSDADEDRERSSSPDLDDYILETVKACQGNPDDEVQELYRLNVSGQDSEEDEPHDLTSLARKVNSKKKHKLTKSQTSRRKFKPGNSSGQMAKGAEGQSRGRRGNMSWSQLRSLSTCRKELPLGQSTTNVAVQTEVLKGAPERDLPAEGSRTLKNIADGVDSFVNVMALVQSLSADRINWRTLLRLLDQKSSEKGDYFALYSWAMRKRLPFRSSASSSKPTKGKKTDKGLHVDGVRAGQQVISLPCGVISPRSRSPRLQKKPWRKELCQTPGELALLVGKEQCSKQKNAQQMSPRTSKSACTIGNNDNLFGFNVGDRPSDKSPSRFPKINAKTPKVLQWQANRPQRKTTSGISDSKSLRGTEFLLTVTNYGSSDMAGRRIPGGSLVEPHREGSVKLPNIHVNKLDLTVLAPDSQQLKSLARRRSRAPSPPPGSPASVLPYSSDTSHLSHTELSGRDTNYPTTPVIIADDASVSSDDGEHSVKKSTRVITVCLPQVDQESSLTVSH